MAASRVRAGNKLRRETFGQLHLGPPWVRNERDAHLAGEVTGGDPLSDRCALGFGPLQEFGKIFYLESDVVERTARGRLELGVALRHREDGTGDLDAIDLLPRSAERAFAGSTA